MKKVLFVDDEARIFESLKRLLHNNFDDLEFIYADSGREALDIISQNKIDVVISDLNMPEMDGITLLEKVKVMAPNTIRIILSGAAPDTKIITPPLVDSFLQKPFDGKSIKNAITQAIANHSR